MNETLTTASRRRLLQGEDDGHPYQVFVPLRCRTVEDALDWLRPSCVPADAPRQGEYYFIRSAGPHDAGCNHYSDRPNDRDCGRIVETEARSTYRWEVWSNASFSRRHHADECWSVVKSGDTMFAGWKRVRSHSWVDRPRYFVRGTVRHPEHSDLVLPPGWFEVVPNKAHSPFLVTGIGQED